MTISLIHRYLGLALCALVFSISLTGVVLVWKKEFLWLTLDAAREVIDVDTLPRAIDNIEASYAQNELIFIQLYSEDLSIHKAFLSGRRYAWHDQAGKQIQLWSGNDRWEDFVLDLHHRFLLGNTIGLNIAGFAGVLLIVLIAFGLIIWWPRRASISFGIWPRYRHRYAWLKAHGNIGGLFAAPILLLSLTGVILVYPIEARFLLLESIAADETVVEKIEHYNADGNFHSWAKLISLAREIFPESRIRSIQVGSIESPKRSVNLQQKNGWHRLGLTSLKFHSNGELVIIDELKKNKVKRVFNFSYPLHAAKLGIFYRITVSLIGLMLAALCIFGLISFLKRPRKADQIRRYNK